MDSSERKSNHRYHKNKKNISLYIREMLPKLQVKIVLSDETRDLYLQKKESFSQILAVVHHIAIELKDNSGQDSS